MVYLVILLHNKHDFVLFYLISQPIRWSGSRIICFYFCVLEIFVVIVAFLWFKTLFALMAATVASSSVAVLPIGDFF